MPEGIDMNREELGNFMSLSEKQPGSLAIKKDGHGEEEGEPDFDLQVGLEFDSAEAAQEFYNSYATQTGFRIRIGQLYRSRVDGAVISRRFVCSKEGFQTTYRTGCQAFIRVQKSDSGKWVIANVNKEHNHELGAPGEISPHRIQRRDLSLTKASIIVPTRTGIRLLDDEDERQSQSCVVDPKRSKIEGVPKVEPHQGLEFCSANEAHKFYSLYAASTGFKVRIGQLFRSKNNGSITSRRFVCSKEGHQHPSRVGCGAFMRIQKKESSSWVVDRFQIEHNHELDSPLDASMLMTAVPKITFKEEVNDGLENLNLVESSGFNLVTRGRQSIIGSDWYSVILEYLQARQAEDTGFFYAVEVDNGQCMSIFWADSRSRFSCSQFGDSVAFDTEYRSSGFLVPFSFFVGINHHRQPVLLGCALIAEESSESFTWVFQTWLKAMSGRKPLSITADQDKAIQQAIAQVFPGTHHRFSSWQIKAQERQYLGALLSTNTEFKYEYEACVHQSQTPSEFDSAWNVVSNKYNLKDNVWLQEMYKMRKSWVPLYIRSTFFAAIPIDGSIKPFFSPLLNAQTPLNEFIIRYEKALELRREEERHADFDSLNVQTGLRTKDPIEEQGRRLYTTTLFKSFQKELLECYSYVGIKINAEGAISRYLVQNGNERTTVAFSASNYNVSCSCKMFDFEGVLCRHALKVFQIMNIRELPSRYILHRWTKNAKNGILRDIGSGGSSQDFKPLMMWCLKEEARNYIEAGATSLERHKLAFEILQEGRRNLCWQN